jgi:hypothetical protein
MARIEEIRVDPWHPWFIFFLGCGFAALSIQRFKNCIHFGFNSTKTKRNPKSDMRTGGGQGVERGLAGVTSA